MTTDLPKITVLDVQENPDGTLTLKFDLSDEFVQWFKEDQGLKRMSQKRFNTWMISVLEKAVQKDGQWSSELR